MNNEVNVMIARLTSGEEIIFEYEDCTNPNGEPVKDRFRIAHPLILIPAQQGNIGLAPWMPYTTVMADGIELSMERVMFFTRPVDGLREAYAQAAVQANMERIQEETGLVLPNTNREIVAAGDPGIAGTIGPSGIEG